MADVKAAVNEVVTFTRRLLSGGGGRQTQPTNFNPFAGMPYAFVPRRLLSGMDLSQLNPSQFAPWQLMQILADSHTDVGLALWNVLRLGTSGFEVKVQTLAGQDDAEGKQIADNLIARLNKKSGGMQAVFIQLMLSWYLYGAVCAELALTENLRDVLDIYPVNPFTIYFRRDAVTQDLVMYQQQLFRPAVDGRTAQSGAKASRDGKTGAGGYRLLNDNLVYYTPCDPTIDDPYGRMPSATVLNEVFFDIGFYQDLQKIVHGVGAPKYVVKIIEEILSKSCPVAIKNDPRKYAGWLDDRLDDVTQMFNNIPADQAFIGFDSVSIDIVSAKGNTNILGLVTPISRAIERRIIKALKMLPILMASNESTTETHGSVQFEIFAEGIHSAQGAIGAMASQMLTIALQLAGRQCIVRCDFPKIKTADRLLSANAEAKEIVNAALKVALGWISNDEGSIEVTGSKAFGTAIPGILESFVPQNQPANAEAPAASRAAVPAPKPDPDIEVRADDEDTDDDE